MTRFAAPLVVQCQNCGTHLLRGQLASFNNFGSMTWSDGYSNNWALNSVAPLACCPVCGRVFWFEDSLTVGILDREPKPMNWIAIAVAKLTGDKKGHLVEQNNWHAIPQAWKRAPYTNAPKIQEFQAILNGVVCLAPYREMYVRRAIWWKCNDHLRKGHDGKSRVALAALPVSEVTANLCALLDLHNNSNEQAPVEKAEILRQLGRFDEATGILKSIDPDDQQDIIAGKIKKFAENKNAEVQEVWRSKY